MTPRHGRRQTQDHRHARRHGRLLPLRQGHPHADYFTGAHNFHSNCEFLPMKSWEKSLEVTLAIIDLTAKNARG